MLLFGALGCLRDEGRHGHFLFIFFSILKKICQSSIVNISASEQSIKKILKQFEEMGMGYPIIFSFLPNWLSTKLLTKYIYLFILGFPSDDFRKSKTPKTICLRGGRLVTCSFFKQFDILKKISLHGVHAKSPFFPIFLPLNMINKNTGNIFLRCKKKLFWKIHSILQHFPNFSFSFQFF